MANGTFRQIKVLLIGPGLNILGGQAVQAKRLLAALRKEPTLTIDFQPIAPLLPEPFRKLQRIPILRTLVNLATYTSQLLARVWRYDIVHVFSAGYSSYMLWSLPVLGVARLFGKKIILNYRDGQADDHLSNWKTAIPTIRMMDAVVSPSGFLVDVFARFGLRIQSISNILPVENFRYRLRSRLRPVFLHNRIMEPLYNIPCSLRAFQMVQQHYPEASLTLAHDGPSRGELEQLAQQLGLRNTQFIGRVPHERIADLYDSVDIYFTSPDFDCMPGSILEAFASGLPVVATASGGIPYIATNEETAMLVPTGDAEAMAKAALRLLAEPGLADRLTANAHASCARYAEAPVREQWMRVYQALMSGTDPMPEPTGTDSTQAFAGSGERVNKTKWGPIALYLIACAALVRWYWYILSPDTLSYFSIAHHYLRGEWMEAINTGWSPMFSWLGLPLLALGLSDLAAFHLVTVASGVVLLYAVQKLAEDFELSSGWRMATEYTAAFMTFSFAMLQLGPDLLEAALLLLYARVVIRSDYGRKGSGVSAGLWAGAAYLTKGYALYFFLGHFAVVCALQFLRLNGERRRAVVGQWALGMVAFAALAGPWFVAMSYKAGHVTTGTTGAWNYRLVGPDAPIYPQYFSLIAPAGPHAYSFWETPSPDLLPAWNALGSGREMKHQAKLIFGNLKVLVAILLLTSLLSFAALFAYAAWGLGQDGNGRRIVWLGALATVLVYPGGYLLITIQERYLWSLIMLVLLMGAAVAQAASKGLGMAGARLLAAGYFLSFVLVPARLLAAEVNFGTWGPIAEQLHRLAPGARGKIAGCGGWNDNVQIAWALNMPSYGEVGPTQDELTVREQMNPDAKGTPAPEADTAEEIAQKLEAFQIDYFLALPTCQTLPSPVQNKPAVAEWQGTRLYRLR